MFQMCLVASAAGFFSLRQLTSSSVFKDCKTETAICMVQRQFTTLAIPTPRRTLFNCFRSHSFMTCPLTTLQIYAKTLKNFAPAKNEETSRFLADVRAHLDHLSKKTSPPAYDRCWVKK